MSYSEFVASRFKGGHATVADMSPRAAQFLHACIGLAGEVHELECSHTRANALEEMGDALFFMEAARQSLELPPELRQMTWESWAVAPSLVELPSQMGALRRNSMELLEMAKKYAIYGKDVDKLAAASHLSRCMTAISAIADFFDTNLQHLLEINRKKLEARYPSGKYSNEQAQARADK